MMYPDSTSNENQIDKYYKVVRVKGGSD